MDDDIEIPAIEKIKEEPLLDVEKEEDSDRIKELETSISVLRQQIDRLSEELANFRTAHYEHTAQFEHKPVREREDRPPGESHWYYRRLGS